MHNPPGTAVCLRERERERHRRVCSRGGPHPPHTAQPSTAQHSHHDLVHDLVRVLTRAFSVTRWSVAGMAELGVALGKVALRLHLAVVAMANTLPARVRYPRVPGHATRVCWERRRTFTAAPSPAPTRSAPR
jgi:hypothetical protein